MTLTGDIIALDRLPRPVLLSEDRKAASRHQTKLLHGGQWEEWGFSVMVRNSRICIGFMLYFK
jgi:hypothetical protein